MWLGLGHPMFEGPTDSVQELVIAHGSLEEKLHCPVTCFLDKARSGLSRHAQGPVPIVCRVPQTP